jgi:hypothetical protein
MEAAELQALKEMVTGLVSVCTDTGLLDLICKLLSIG